MKLKDNSRFPRVVVVRWPASNLFKSKGLVKISPSLIRFPHFQEYGARNLSEPRTKQVPGHAFPAETGLDRQVQNLAFAFRQTARHEEFLEQVVLRLPLCRTG